jgi:hypothetical protein
MELADDVLGPHLDHCGRRRGSVVHGHLGRGQAGGDGEAVAPVGAGALRPMRREFQAFDVKT